MSTIAALPACTAQEVSILPHDSGHTPWAGNDCDKPRLVAAITRDRTAINALIDTIQTIVGNHKLKISLPAKLPGCTAQEVSMLPMGPGHTPWAGYDIEKPRLVDAITRDRTTINALIGTIQSIATNLKSKVSLPPNLPACSAQEVSMLPMGSGHTPWTGNEIEKPRLVATITKDRTTINALSAAIKTIPVSAPAVAKK